MTVSRTVAFADYGEKKGAVTLAYELQAAVAKAILASNTEPESLDMDENGRAYIRLYLDTMDLESPSNILAILVDYPIDKGVDIG